MAAKMTAQQAAAKAFRDCRLNHAKSRAAASYLFRQHFIASGATIAEAAEASQTVEPLLDQWFKSREANPGFTPNVSAAAPAE